MSDSLRPLRWRAALAVTGAIMAWMVWSATGGGVHIIQIEFGIAPEVLVGAEVLIDGESVGTIARPRARTVNGFEVEPGIHTVELRLADFGAEPITIDTKEYGGSALLMVDFSERRGADGGTESVLVLY